MKKVVIIENGKINHIGVFLQCVLLVVLIILGICSVFIPGLKFVTECSLVGLLGVMGYNNYSVFKRKGWTLIYCVAALFIFITAIVGIFNV